MVFESACVVDMIPLDMFRPYVRWGKSLEILSDEVSSATSRKITQNRINRLETPKMAAIYDILGNFARSCTRNLV